MTAICPVILSCKKTADLEQTWHKFCPWSERKQTVPDSSVYLKGECKKAGLREPTQNKISGLIFHSGRSFRQKNKTDEL